MESVTPTLDNEGNIVYEVSYFSGGKRENIFINADAQFFGFRSDGEEGFSAEETDFWNSIGCGFFLQQERDGSVQLHLLFKIERLGSNYGTPFIQIGENKNRTVKVNDKLTFYVGEIISVENQVVQLAGYDEKNQYVQDLYRIPVSDNTPIYMYETNRYDESIQYIGRDIICILGCTVLMCEYEGKVTDVVGFPDVFLPSYSLE